MRTALITAKSRHTGAHVRTRAGHVATASALRDLEPMDAGRGRSGALVAVRTAVTRRWLWYALWYWLAELASGECGSARFTAEGKGFEPLGALRLQRFSR